MRNRLVWVCVLSLVLVTAVGACGGQTRVIQSNPGAAVPLPHSIAGCDEGCRALHRMNGPTPSECDEGCRALQRIPTHS